MSDAAITINALANAVSAIAALHDVDFAEHGIRTTQQPQLRAGGSLRSNLRTTDSIDRAR